MTITFRRTVTTVLVILVSGTVWSAAHAQEFEQEPRHHPDCPDGVALPPSGLTVAGYLNSTRREQSLFTEELVTSLEEAADAPPACRSVLTECFGEMNDSLPQAVAQGYLTGRTALVEADAAAGVLEALEQYCLGTWTPGGTSRP